MSSFVNVHIETRSLGCILSGIAIMSIPAWIQHIYICFFEDAWGSSIADAI